jgi:CHAT domain-containing protein/Tfp pilus assembly protein PilF
MRIFHPLALVALTLTIGNAARSVQAKGFDTHRFQSPIPQSVNRSTDDRWITQSLYQQANLLITQAPSGADANAVNQAIAEKRYNDALRILQKAETFYRQKGDQAGLASTLTQTASVYRDKGELAKAKATIDEAAALAKQSNNPQTIATMGLVRRMVYLDMGNNLLGDRQYDAALKVFQETLRMTEQNRDEDGQMLSLMKLGEVYRSQYQFKQSLPFYERAATLITRQDGFSQTAVLFVLGRTYADLGNYAKADRLYADALNNAEKNGDEVTAVTVKNNIASLIQERGRYRESGKIYEEILVSIEKILKRYHKPITAATISEHCQIAKTDQAPFYVILGQFCDKGLPAQFLADHTEGLRQAYLSILSQLEGTSLNNLGISQAHLGNYPAAIASHKRSLKIHGENSRSRAATSWNNLGNVYLNQGDYPTALKHYEKAMELAKATRSLDLQATTLTNIAQIYESQGQYRQAITTNQTALKMLRGIGDQPEEATILNNLGSNYMAIADYAQSHQALDQSLSLYRKFNSLAGEATALNNLSILAGNRGDYTTSIDLGQQALKIAQSLGDKEQELAFLSNLGRDYADIAQYAKAFDLYNQALILARQLPSPSWESSTMGNMASTYRAIGRYDKAEQLYKQVITQAGQRGEPLTQAIAQSGNASTLLDQRQAKAALPLLQTALQTHQRLGAKSHEISTQRNLARLYSQQQQPDQAIMQLQQVLQSARGLGLAIEETLALHELAQIYLDAGRYAEAKTTAQQAATLAVKVEDKLTQAKALTIIGSASLATNQPAPAQTALTQAIDLWETTRPGLQDRDKVSLLDVQALTYRLMQQSLVAQGKTQEALEISEQGRARALVELFAARQSQPITPPKLAEITTIARQQKATLVQYSQVTDRDIYIWVIKPDGQISFRQADLSQIKGSINGIVTNARDSIGVRKVKVKTIAALPAETASQSINDFKALHQALIAPIAQDLPQDANQPVIFMPQGSLFLVPFAALEDHQGKVLLEKHTIAVAPSLQALSLTQKLAQNKSSLSNQLVVGNPTMPKLEDFELDPLPGAEREAIQVAQLLNTKPLLGNRATKTQVMQQMPQSQVIHLATHGLLDTVRGDVPGAIVLAGNGQEGLLTASEIADMRLQADLVVLSACSTGKGDITGDGVLGLSRSLFLAGVPSVVVSLWDVDDSATETLMTAFYQNWRSGQMTKAQALRQAMLTTKARFNDPSKWAAFNLIGAL